MKIKSWGFILALSTAVIAYKGYGYFKHRQSPAFKAHNLQQLIEIKGNHPSIGLIVTDLKTNKILIAQNEDQYFMPASNQKIFTAAASLHHYAPDATFDTILDANLEGLDQGVLNHPVKLIFSGDPSFKTQDLHALIKGLQDKGVHTLKKDIWVDLHAFDDTPISPGSSIEDIYYCWMAPLTSGILNHNCVGLWVEPNEKLNQPIKIIRSKPSNIAFESEALTYPKDHAPCIFDFKWSHDKSYLLKGCLIQGSGQQKFEFANPKPNQTLKKQIKIALKKNKIHLLGHIKLIQNKSLTSRHPLHIHHSKPIADLVKDMMKDSDNLIANSLFKTLGASMYQKPGSFNKGGRALSSLINEFYKLETSPKSFIDGSGTSRYNFVTPKQIMAILVQSYHQPIRKHFINSLPISGVDGSLKNRMKTPELKGRISAKTGSMSGVSSLSGYITTQSGKKLAFTILINGYVDSLGDLKILEDKVCASLVRM